MCNPVFRDAIVFYKEGQIISHLNSCLSCDWVETCNRVTIDTDSIAFPRLKAFFTANGHSVEE